MSRPDAAALLPVVAFILLAGCQSSLDASDGHPSAGSGSTSLAGTTSATTGPDGTADGNGTVTGSGSLSSSGTGAANATAGSSTGTSSANTSTPDAQPGSSSSSSSASPSGSSSSSSSSTGAGSAWRHVALAVVNDGTSTPAAFDCYFDGQSRCDPDRVPPGPGETTFHAIDLPSQPDLFSVDAPFDATWPTWTGSFAWMDPSASIEVRFSEVSMAATCLSGCAFA